MKISKMLLLILLGLIIVLAACSGSNDSVSKDTGDGSGDQGNVQISDPIKVGVSLVRTGGNAEAGEDMLAAIRVAQALFNDGGGINGREIELVVRDNEGDPSRGVNIMREFGQREEVVAGLGGFLSTVMLAQTPIIKQEEFPFLVMTSNVPASVEDGVPWTFGVRMHAETTAKFAVDFLERHYNTNKIAILHEDGGYGQGAVNAMTKVLAEKGLEPAAVEHFNLSDRDMTAQVTRARDSGAEAVYLFGIGASNGYVLSAMNRIGWDVPVVGETGFVQSAIPEVAGSASDGAYALLTANFVDPQEREMADFFLEKVEEMFDYIPQNTGPVAQAFDAAMLLFTAMEHVEFTGDLAQDRIAVREALINNAGPYEGVVRDYNPAFSPGNHEALTVDSYVVNVWQNGVLRRSDKQ